MECPKCGLEIDDKAMVCPNCKKVLKLSCPICKTINDTNTCKKCGYVIISKCHNCGKINQTISKKCRKCGFDTEKNVIINEANSDDFVLMTIDFPNLDEMSRLLGSVKLYNKFKINLDGLIAKYAKSIGLRRQIIGRTTVIRFTKDYTFNGSVASAIKSAVELLNQITAMNCKLSGKKDATIKCNIFLLKRNVSDDPSNIDSGFNINLISNKTKTKEQKLLNTFQVLIDDRVADAISDDYRVSPLNSVLIGNEMVMFSEVDLKEHVKIEYPQEEIDEIEIPNFVQNMLVEQDKLDGEALKKLDSNGADPDAIYDIDTINFEDIRCDFIRTENIDAVFHIMNKFQSIPKGIVALKTPEMYKPYTLKVLNAIAETEQFNNIISLTCYDEMKYAPYSFFRELVSAIFEYTVSQKLFFQNDFSMFSKVDPDGLVRDLITLQTRDTDNAEDTRLVYFEIFLTLLQVIPKTLIFIDDFDKIDSSSYDVLKYLFNAFEDIDVSFLVSYDKNFSLHKDCYFLLRQPYYTEISLKPTTFEKLIEDNKVYFKNVLDNFYFQRIAKYACGSSLFIDIAIQYLIESEVFAEDGESVKMINPKTIIIPSNLDKLIARRLNLLQDDAKAMKFLATIVLIGTRVDMGTIDSLGYENAAEIIEKLTNMGYVYEFNNCIYFPNYNLLRRNMLTTISPIALKEIAQDLFDKVYNNEDMPSTTEAYLYSLLGEKDKERAEWEALAKVNISLGDFSSYVNCISRVIELLDEINDPEQRESIQKYKDELYEKISENLYDYIPEKTAKIAEDTLRNIEKTGDTDKIIQLCNKLILGALNSGDYTNALDLTHKVLALLPPSSINPADENFNHYFFLISLIHIQVLFNVGALVDCLDVGYKVLNVVNNSTIEILKPDYYSIDDFKMLITDSAGFVALANVLLMTGAVGEFLNILRQELDFVPQSYDLFITAQEVLKRHDVAIPNCAISPNDKFGGFLLHLLHAFVGNDGEYAEHIYKAKIIAKDNMLYQLELFADLLIANAYVQAQSFKKAEAIIYKIIKESSGKGMTNILYAAWYIMSELSLKQNKYDVAFGIINNSLIQLEKNTSTSEYLLLLFKYNMFKVMMFKQQYEKAQICLGHAQYLAQKYDIHFDFDIDTNHYIPIGDDDNNINEELQDENNQPNEQTNE
jgi:hypothetical protein